MKTSLGRYIVLLRKLLSSYYFPCERSYAYCFLLQIADFGLTKLTDVASSTDNTIHVAGTFGYMPPEYDKFCFLFT